MTQQAYEQKKRERWEEAVLHGALEVDKDLLFDHAFKCGYALGRVKEPISQEDIEKAAQEHADELRVSSAIPSALMPMLHDIAKTSYLQGAQDFNGTQEKDADTVISGWVLVDDTTFKRIVRVHKITQGDYESVWDSGEPEFYLEEEVFPDMTPDSYPEPVEIIIKRKKK